MDGLAHLFADGGEEAGIGLLGHDLGDDTDEQVAGLALEDLGDATLLEREERFGPSRVDALQVVERPVAEVTLVGGGGRGVFLHQVGDGCPCAKGCERLLCPLTGLGAVLRGRLAGRCPGRLDDERGHAAGLGEGAVHHEGVRELILREGDALLIGKLALIDEVDERFHGSGRAGRPGVRTLREPAVGEVLVDGASQELGAGGGVGTICAERLQPLPFLPFASADLRTRHVVQRLEVRLPVAVAQTDDDRDRRGHDEHDEADGDVPRESRLGIVGAAAADRRGSGARSRGAGSESGPFGWGGRRRGRRRGRRGHAATVLRFAVVVGGATVGVPRAAARC
jgi:hypothetical protein